ncbi:MAG: hypothetical protein R3F14_38640 [Polyangiaceae bacterium]
MRVPTLLRCAVLASAVGAALVPGAIAPRPAFAQAAKGTVTPLIQRAAELFDDQQYEESIQTLSAALLRPGSSMKEKIEIYRLLAYNYITLKRNDEADAAVRGLYVLDESFTLPVTESPRFRDFFEATRKKWVEEGKPGKNEGTGETAAEAPVKIAHTSPAQGARGMTIKLTGSIDDANGRVRGVQLYYRIGTKGKFHIVAGTYTLGKFNTSIPGKEVAPPLVEYYLEAVDNGGLPVASRGDAGAPLRIVVPEPEQNSVVRSPALWVPLGVVVVGVAVGVPVGMFLLGQKQTATVKVGVK